MLRAGTTKRLRDVRSAVQQNRKQDNLIKYQQMFDEVVNTQHEYLEGSFKGRGIVICGGGNKYFPLAHTLIYILEKLECQLPIELWTMPNEHVDERLIPTNVRLCTSDKKYPGFALKPYAILHSDFEEVLLIDADNIPTREPSFLFDTPEYQKCGAIFWQDISGTRGKITEEGYEAARVLPNHDPELGTWFLESGQLVINKKRCCHELVCAWHLNEHNDYWYRKMYGDKDTFKLAWNRCGTEYATPQMPGWKTPAIIQYDFNGEILFYHCCQGKSKITNAIPISILPEQYRTWIKEAAQLRAGNRPLHNVRLRSFGR